MASIFDQIFGRKPQVAPYRPTQLSAEQVRAIMENISSFPEIQQLGGLYEQYMLDSFRESGFDLAPILQGGEQMVQQMENIGQQFLRGEIPQDVQDQIRRQDALTSMLSGGPGGANALTARDLGLTSLNLINQGANLAGQAGNAAQRWAGLASGLIMSPSGMMVTPQQQAALTMQNNLYQQATQQLRNNIAAAPNPGLQALNQWVEQVGGTILSSYATGGMGGRGTNFETSYGGYGNSMGGGMASPGATQGFGGFNASGVPGMPAGGVPTAAMTYGDVFNPLGDPYGLGGYYG